MWELSRLPSYRDISVRRILTYALAALLAAFLWTILFVTPTYAADATWSGNIIQYDGNDYTGPASAKTVKELNLFDGTKTYTFVEPAPTTVGTTPAPQRKIHVIYFAPSVDSSVATGAMYKTYIYKGPSKFSDPSSPEKIAISQQSTAANPGTKSCDVDSGVGWMICPITNFLAKGMDWIFNVLAGFLAVRPVGTGLNDSIFRAWTYMRSFANVAFVIAFLIIIYSQLTNVGITNYSIKKLMPRLIIAALLVNLSYYICAVAVDISNILGYSVQDIFIQIRNSLVGTEGNSWDIINWESVTGFILSSGTLATAGTIGLVSTISTYGLAGSIFLLLPALLTGLIAVLVALVIMAARQAIITILIIIAPLAFVAYLLPNTDKWFDKWRSTFMTMLILFPAFSLVFGGSQLAASAIIQNADSINLVILGMIVQVAPLFVTPLLLKLSGSLLGKIAGVINNPNKGMLDRTKNWSKDRADNVKARRLGTEAKAGFRGAAQRNAQRVEHNRRKREGWKAAYTGRTDADWANSQDFNDLDQDVRKSGDRKALGESVSEGRFNQSKIGNVEIQTLDINLRNAKLNVENTKAAADVQFSNLKASESVLNVVPAHLAGQALVARSQAQRARVLTSQQHFAEHEQQQDYAKAMAASEALQREAGGIAEKGKDASFATAVATIRKTFLESVTEAREINKYFNLSGQERQMHALGNQAFTKTDADGNVRSFDSGGTFTRAAAIQDQLNFSIVPDGDAIIAASGSTLREFSQLISDTVAEGKFAGKAIYGGGKTIEDIAQHRITSMVVLDEIVAETIAKGKISEHDLANQDMDALAKLFEVAQRNDPSMITDPKYARVLQGRIVELSDKARKTLTGDEKVNVKGIAKDRLMDIAQLTDPTFDPEDPKWKT